MQYSTHLIPLLLLLSSTAFAQPSLSTDSTLVGAGARWRPAYDGSKAHLVEPVPLVRYYNAPWFARSTYGIFEGGVRTELATGLTFGAQLAYENGRKQRDADLLRTLNVPDINPSASAGVQIEWQTRLGPVPFGALARLRQQLETGRGAQADLRFSAGVLATNTLQVALFTQAAWADAESNHAFYGLPGAEPGGGLNTIGAGAQGFCNFARHWTWVANLEARRIEGNVSRSRLVERTTSVYVTTGIAYRF